MIEYFTGARRDQAGEMLLQKQKCETETEVYYFINSRLSMLKTDKYPRGYVFKTVCEITPLGNEYLNLKGIIGNCRRGAWPGEKEEVRVITEEDINNCHIDWPKDPVLQKNKWW
jgi:hypothetical protein